MAGSAARANAAEARRLTARICCQSSSEVSAVGAYAGEMPALFTSPQRSPISAAAATACGGTEGSSTAPTTMRLGPGSDAATAARSSPERATSTTLPPACDTARAVPAPMPRDAPVMMTTRSSSRKGASMSQGYAGHGTGVPGTSGAPVPSCANRPLSL